MQKRPGETFRILLVEDNPGDARLAREALRDNKIRSSLTVLEDGFEVMEYLQRRGQYAHIQPPHLILLDLNLPGKSGAEVLQEIKSDPRLRRIPVIVLTTSTAYHDIDSSYDLHANCYVIKPLDIMSFAQVLRQIEAFWFNIVTLPRIAG
jgi:chemotaxis family two-component system response regulator Rcp1